MRAENRIRTGILFRMFFSFHGGCVCERPARSRTGRSSYRLVELLGDTLSAAVAVSLRIKGGLFGQE